MEITRDMLLEFYISEQKTAKEIANRFGFKSSQTILNMLGRFDIPTRDGRNAQKPIELTRDQLVRLYIERGLSIDNIARQVGSSELSISRMLDQYNITKRVKHCKIAGSNKGKPMSNRQRIQMSEIRKRMYQNGETTHWNKGKHWNRDVKEKISATLLNGRIPAPNDYGQDWRLQRTECLIRDDYTCQECGSKESPEVHHWEPYRFCFDNSLDNLVVLCADCHRQKHEDYRREGFIREAELELYG